MARPISRKEVATFEQEMMELHNVLTRHFSVINIIDPVPLEPRIERQLSEQAGMSRQRATRFICWYFSKSKYLQSILDKEHRFNLKGEIIGFITPEQREHAKNKLNMRINHEDS